jgi:hypothetical protein
MEVDTVRLQMGRMEDAEDSGSPPYHASIDDAMTPPSTSDGIEVRVQRLQSPDLEILPSNVPTVSAAG